MPVLEMRSRAFWTKACTRWFPLSSLSKPFDTSLKTLSSPSPRALSWSALILGGQEIRARRVSLFMTGGYDGRGSASGGETNVSKSTLDGGANETPRGKAPGGSGGGALDGRAEGLGGGGGLEVRLEAALAGGGGGGWLLRRLRRERSAGGGGGGREGRREGLGDGSGGFDGRLTLGGFFSMSYSFT